MTDINSMFDCFEESVQNEAATQLPNIDPNNEKT